MVGWFVEQSKPLILLDPFETSPKLKECVGIMVTRENTKLTTERSGKKVLLND